jgi:hypothetical protein
MGIYLLTQLKHHVMKKFIMLLMIAVASASAFAQVKPPEAVENAFKKTYPKISAVKWEKENGEFEGSFVQDGTKMSVVYSPAGELKETETSIKLDELPAAASSYIAQHYKNAKIGSTEKINKANGEVFYEAEVNKKDVVFDKAGKFVKEEKD